MRYVIIGNSAAAVHAVEGIRRLDGEGEIIVFSRESYLAYSRPLITEFLFDGIQERKMSYRDASFYRRNKVDLRLSTEVVKIDREKKEVVDGQGRATCYDRLLLSAGGEPFVPPVKGGEKEGIFTMMDWDSAREVKKLLRNTSHAVVLGGGLIGMKTAEGIFEAGVKTSVVELAPQILGRILDREGASLFVDHLEESGMDIITGDTVVEVSGEGKISRVLLRSGGALECDMLIMAIGVTANMSLADESGIETNRGVVVNDRMETSDSQIFAAGDIAEASDTVVGEKRVNAIWPVANYQGRIAGINMAGGDRVFDGAFPKNSLKLLGLETISMGMVDPPDDTFEVQSKLVKDKKYYRKFIHKEGTLYGGIFIGEVEKAGIVTGMVRDRVKINGDLSHLLEGQPRMIMVDKGYRDEKLTRPVTR